MFHGSDRLIQRVTNIAPGAFSPNISGPQTYTSPPTSTKGATIVKIATPNPTRYDPSSIKDFAAPGKVRTVCMLAASISTKGVVWTIAINSSAVRENDVTRTSEAGRFW